ncbi:MAG: aminotransferase class I/II-fold pyridoxal phosphate-dependent enzyme [Bryobacteraceae bacterium]
MRSAYMEWVKTLPPVAFNLANSGVKNYPLSGLPVDFNSLTLSGPGAYGYRPLIHAIAAKCGVEPDCVATAQGTSMANLLAMAVAIERGDEVLIEHPAYPLLWETAQYLGGNIKYFERPAAEKFAIEIDALERSVTPRTRLIVLTNLHNPSCAYTDEATLRRAGDIAASVGARVLVDEVYLDLLFDTVPRTAFHLGPEFIVTNSLTKVYGLSGLRCGWVLADPDLIRKMYRLNDLFYVNAPYVTDQLSCIALAHLDIIAQSSQELLQTNSALAREFLSAAPELDCEQAAIGTVLFPRIGFPAEDFCRLLMERYETVVTPGRFFGSPDRIRIGIGGESTILAEGLSRVLDALKANRESTTRTVHS